MNTRNAITAAGLLVSLAFSAPAAFAQNAETAKPPAGAAAPAPQPPEKAPQAPGSPDAASAESLAQSVAMKIHDARREGKDVKVAEAQEKQGEAALRAGFKAEALEHFRKAEISLNEQSEPGDSGGAISGNTGAPPSAETH